MSSLQLFFGGLAFLLAAAVVYRDPVYLEPEWREWVGIACFIGGFALITATLLG